MIAKNGIDWTELGFVVHGECPEYKKYNVVIGKNVAFKKSYRDWNRWKNFSNVCEEWLDYDQFNKWYEENHYTVDGERTMLSYRFWNFRNQHIVPEECVFLPEKIYFLMQIYEKPDDELPRGVHIVKKSGKYEVNLTENNKSYYRESFETKEDALSAYENRKREKLIEIAENYKGILSEKIIDRLINFRLE